MCLTLQTHFDAPTADDIENIAVKGEIAQNLNLYNNTMYNSPLFRFFTVLPRHFRSRLLQVCNMRERVKLITLTLFSLESQAVIAIWAILEVLIL